MQGPARKTALGLPTRDAVRVDRTSAWLPLVSFDDPFPDRESNKFRDPADTQLAGDVGTVSLYRAWPDVENYGNLLALPPEGDVT